VVDLEDQSVPAMEMTVEGLLKTAIRGKCLQKLMICLKRAKNSSECLWAEVLKEVAVARVILVTAVWDAIALY
jgi:hypothetical protein